MTEKIKNDIPQFVACGLEMGNCPRQIPYDMAEHERIIMTDLLDKVAEKLKDNMCSCSFKGTELCDVSGCGFDIDIDSVHKTIDEVIAELKAEVSE